MLLATPYLPFETVSNSGPPRIISEIRKTSPVKPREQIRPRISGDLLVIYADEQRWLPRRVIVRGGQLLIGSTSGENAAGGLRLPLRHLSLAAGPLPNSLALYRGQNKILTIQTANERAFNVWVKTIAIELIRQTPLEAVRYLDILNLTDSETNNKKDQDCEKDWNYNDIEETAHLQYNLYNNTSQPTPKDEPTIITKQETPKIDELNVEVLLKRCQNSDNYVPVKDKLILFESLCRLGRKVRSTEDVSIKAIVESNKRASSMHDISNCISSVSGVKQICKYFENKTDTRQSSKYASINRTKMRLIHSDSQLNDITNSYRIENQFQKFP